ncbi:MAG: glycosyltransferase [Candidatus Bathyarchaeales archaeon]
MVLKTAGVVALSSALTGLTASALTAQYVISNYKPELDFYQHRHPYHVNGFEEPKGELAFTYYYDGYKGAFNRVAMAHVEELKRRGFTVRLREIHEWLVHFKYPDVEPLKDFAVVHPLFFTAPAGLRYLAKKHRYVLAFEVADTTHISKDWCRWANSEDLDCLFVPSKFSFEAYIRSGVQNRLEVLPHGVSENFSKPKEEFTTVNPVLKAIRQDPRPKILFFCLHSGKTRKGSVEVYEALKRLMAKGRKFLLVVKTHPKESLAWYDAKTEFPDIPLVQVDQWLSEQDVIYLYDNCDVYVHPYKGGAFELNVYEALARGLPVIVTGWGCVLEYCDFHTAYLITPKEYVRVFPFDVGRGGHIGWGVKPDVDHFVELLEFVLDNLDYCKGKAMKNRGLYTRQTWSKVIDQFLKEVEKVWDTR